MSFRRIVGNLDFERVIAPNGNKPPRRISPAAVRQATLLGSLLRVFASDGDRLWLPGPLPPGRVTEIPGVPEPHFETGDLRRLEPASVWLAWGETEAIATLRAHSLGESAAETDPESPLWMRVWRLPRPVPAVARHVHHRQTHATLAKELGLSLAGQKWITTVESLEEHLADGAASYSPTDQWILKPAISASGRDWVRGQGPTLSPNVRSQMEKHLSEAGGFLFEPRLDRVRDVGVSLAITESGVEVIGRHDLENAPNGRFQGARPLPPAGRGRADPFADQVIAAALRTGERLISLGFRGACGIDAWLGKDSDGDLRPQLLGEINARLTFGWVTHAWRARLIAAGAIDEDSVVTLRSSEERRPPPGAISLLAATGSEPLAAWIEVEAPRLGGLAARKGTR